MWVPEVLFFFMNVPRVSGVFCGVVMFAWSVCFLSKFFFFFFSVWLVVFMLLR